MKRFDVLDPATPFKGPLLLEASAGTGKTFTLQHLFIRHLLEGVPPQEIAVITFTRAATRELKNRLRQAVQEALKTAADGKEYLEKALSDIDLTSIRTIHSFLAELQLRFAWEAKLPLLKESLNRLPILEEKVLAVRDYLRSDLSKQHLRYAEELLFSQEDFELKVAKAMSPALNVPSIPIEAALQKLSTLSWSRELLLDLIKPFKKGKKGDGLDWLNALADVLEGRGDLNAFLSQGSPLTGVLEEDNRRQKAPSNVLWDEEVFTCVKDEIIPLTAQLTDKKWINKYFAKAIYPFYRERAKESGPDELLAAAGDLIDLPPFVEALRKAYRVVLVDEFQDTDPIQWKILSKAFLDPSWGGSLTLVGDPKQAIYSFRNADLKVYYQAKETIGKEHCYRLTHNYRSHPDLIKSLNHLFSAAEHVYSYEPVEAGVLPYPLESPPITFVEAISEEELFRFVAEKLQTTSEGSVALLIKDQYQEARLQEILQSYQIETRLYRTPSWEDKDLVKAIKTIFTVLESPESRERIIHFFSTPFFQEALFKRKEEEVAEMMAACLKLQKIYLRQGAPALFEAMLSLGIGSWILSQPEGTLLFERLQKLFVDLEKGVPSRRFPDVFKWLERIHLGLETQVLEEKSPPTHEKVPILLTIHVSKGLEFDTVFALGVCAPSNLHNEEDEAEALRQLYVAFTRAKKKLYIPLYPTTSKRKSSLDLFLEACGGEEKLFSLPEIEKITASPSEEPLLVEKPQTIIPPPPPKPHLSASAPPLLSFSSIREKSFKVKTIANPGGSDFGTAVHDYLAEIPLETFRKAHSPADLPIPESDIAELVFRAFKTPFVTPYGTFALEEIEEGKMIREGEFLFVDEEQGVFTGFIDVAFEYQGKIFLIDWKTHLLLSYDQPSLQEEMITGDYVTQEKLYRKALIKHFGPRFGGSLFVFLRGLNPSQEGVWYAP